jgi:hypothetical protein
MSGPRSSAPPQSGRSETRGSGAASGTGESAFAAAMRKAQEKGQK